MARLFDAHNHLQDERIVGRADELLEAAGREGLVSMCVNGSCPDDWDAVLELARRHSCIVPSFGCHPWHLEGLRPDWQVRLVEALASIPSGVGEIGIDGWRGEIDDSLQERVFFEQLEVASTLGRPVSIHGLRRWGRLLELLKAGPKLSAGFLLHSYGGSRELVPQFAKLGGFFSCPGYFLRPGCEKKLETFRHVPRDRLLVETDAPDQALPVELERFSLGLDNNGHRLNHPGNISAVYAGLSRALETDLEQLATQVEANFASLFGSCRRM